MNWSFCWTTYLDEHRKSSVFDEWLKSINIEFWWSVDFGWRFRLINTVAKFLWLTESQEFVFDENIVWWTIFVFFDEQSIYMIELWFYYDEFHVVHHYHFIIIIFLFFLSFLFWYHNVHKFSLMNIITMFISYITLFTSFLFKNFLVLTTFIRFLWWATLQCLSVKSCRSSLFFLKIFWFFSPVN